MPPRKLRSPRRRPKAANQSGPRTAEHVPTSAIAEEQVRRELPLSNKAGRRADADAARPEEAKPPSATFAEQAALAANKARVAEEHVKPSCR